MIDQIVDKLTSDTTWIYTALAGSVIGGLFVAYIRETAIGLWIYAKWDGLLDYIIDKLGWTWFTQHEDNWKKRYPTIVPKIEELERKIKKLEEK